MKKLTTLLFLLTLAIGASAQSARIRPNAHVGPTARSASIKRTATVVPPVSRTPNAVGHAKKK
jgi:hypothetical protein